MTTPMERWYRTFFDATALDLWQRSRDEALTELEAEYLEATLGVSGRASRLLDVPCGNGRHAVLLAQLGHAVTGVDLTEANRPRLEARASALGVDIELVIADMCNLTFSGGFEGAYCWGNSLGYFPRRDMEAFFAGVAAALEPGARFVVDTSMVAESILVELHPQSWMEVDDQMRVLLRCDYDPVESRLDTAYTTLVGDRVVGTRTAHVWVFTSGELVAMAQAAGFSVVALESDLDGTPFELGSERLLLVLERR